MKKYILPVFSRPERKALSFSQFMGLTSRFEVSRTWLITGIFLLLSISSCKKEKTEPKHRDVFKCEINGLPWEAACESGTILWGCNMVDCQYYPDVGGFEIGASNRDFTEGISFRNDLNEGGITLGTNLFTKMTFGIMHDTINKSYRVKYENPGTVIIYDINEESKIIEGGFMFVGYDENLETIEVSKGYFKVKYRP